MLAGDWRKYRDVVRLGSFALAALLAAVTLYGLGVLVGQNLGYYDAQADGYAAQYQRDTDSRVRDCFAQSVGVAAKECVENAVAASRDAQRGEQDLGAQRQMAKWALWLLIFTAGQSILGILGFIALIVTIRQGREANEIARDSLVLSNRAWLMCTGADSFTFNGRVGDKPVEGGVALELDWKNAGRTPATKVTVFRSYRMTDPKAAPPTFHPNPAGGEEMATVGVDVTITGETVLLDQEQTQLFIAKKAVVYLYNWVQYRDVLSSETHTCEACYRIAHRGHAVGPDGKEHILIQSSPRGLQNTFA